MSRGPVNGVFISRAHKFRATNKHTIATPRRRSTHWHTDYLNKRVDLSVARGAVKKESSYTITMSLNFNFLCYNCFSR